MSSPTRSSSSSRSAPTRSPAPLPRRSTPASAGACRRSSTTTRPSRPAPTRLLLPRPRACRGARAARGHCRRRSLRRPPADGSGALSGVVRLRASPPGRLVVRPPGGLPAGGQPDREPGLLRDGGAARACAARGRDRAGRRHRRREVGRLGRRQDPEAGVARGGRARERLAVQGRRAPARTGDRAGARLPGLLRTASPARAPRPDRHVLRPLGRRPSRAARSRLRDDTGRFGPARGSDPGALARAGHRRGRDRRLQRPFDRHVDRRLRARQPRQGRRRPGGAEREPRARARRDGRASGSRGVLV